MPGVGWVAAEDLAPGTELTSPDGSMVVVVGNTARIDAQPVTVYNLEVWNGNHHLLHHPEQRRGAGVGASDGSAKVLVRYGTQFTEEQLAAQAAEAEATIGIHGVSTFLRKAPGFGHGEVALEEAKKVFEIIQTGNNKSHFTVVIPKPVTEAVVNALNNLFHWVG